MPLTLVLGPANSAKAGEVLGGFAAAAQRGAILVVPTAVDADHFSRELARDGAVLGSVLTFNGLASEIADRAGYAARRLTPLQRERVLAKALGATQFDALRAAAATAGFPQAAGELIAELQRSLITPERFAAAMGSWAAEDPRRRPYARDVAAIYSAYAAELERLGRVDPELYTWRALDALRAAPGRWGTESLFFYGFDDLHPLERDAIETLARVVGAEVTVSLTYEAGRSALTARAEVVEELRPLADRVQQLPASAEHYDPDSRHALHHLERELFELEPERVDPGTAIQLLEAGGELAEAELAAAEVLSLIRSGVPGDEIAVVYRSPAHAATLVEHVFGSYGIPVATDRRTALHRTPLGHSLLALARVALTNDTEAGAEDLIEYLRGPGMADRADAVDRLESVVRRRALRTVAEARQRADFELPEVDALRAAEDPGAELLAHARRLLAAPHRLQAPVLDAGEELDARAVGTLARALAELEELGEQTNGARADRAARDARAAGRPAGRAGRGAADRPARDPGETVSRGARVRPPGERVPARAGAGTVPLGRAPPRARRVQRAPAAPARGRARPRALPVLHERRRARPKRWSWRIGAPTRRGTSRCPPRSWPTSPSCSPKIGPTGAGAGCSPTSCGRRTRRPTERELARAHAAALAPLAGEVPSPIGALSEVALEHVRHRQILSAGALESYAGCPVRWLIERELQPVALEPDPDPLVRGGYMHSVIEQVLRRLGGPVTRESLPRALEILDEVMAQQPHAIALGGGVGGPGGRGARSRRRPAPVPRARGPRRARLAAVRPRAPVRLRRRRRRSAGVAPAAGARRRRPRAWDRRPRRRR